jgi:hypothetical protein
MTYDEVTQGLLNLFADPEKADPSKSNEFLDKLRGDYTDRDSMADKIKTLEDENKRLKDRNAYYAQLAIGRLDASQITGKDPEKGHEPEENPMQTPDDLDRFLTEHKASTLEQGKEE